jgi:hypothetical protein
MPNTTNFDRYLTRILVEATGTTVVPHKGARNDMLQLLTERVIQYCVKM